MDNDDRIKQEKERMIEKERKMFKEELLNKCNRYLFLPAWFGFLIGLFLWVLTFERASTFFNGLEIYRTTDGKFLTLFLPQMLFSILVSITGHWLFYRQPTKEYSMSLGLTLMTFIICLICLVYFAFPANL